MFFATTAYKKTTGATGGFKIAGRLFLLVSHHSESFLPFVCCNLMLFSFASTRHCSISYFARTGQICNYGVYYHDFSLSWSRALLT
jgi:hypothetical protein